MAKWEHLVLRGWKIRVRSAQILALAQQLRESFPKGEVDIDEEGGSIAVWCPAGDGSRSSPEEVDLLDALGEMGWELVGYTIEKAEFTIKYGYVWGPTTYVFKRPLP